MSEEGDACFEFFSQVLFARTGVRVWEGAHDGSNEAIVCSLNRGGGNSFHARKRVQLTPRWVVKAVVKNDTMRARELANIIDDELDGRRNEPITGTNCVLDQCYWEEEVRYEEREGTVKWFHRGGIYAPRVRREG